MVIPHDAMICLVSTTYWPQLHQYLDAPYRILLAIELVFLEAVLATLDSRHLTSNFRGLCWSIYYLRV